MYSSALECVNMQYLSIMDEKCCSLLSFCHSPAHAHFQYEKSKQSDTQKLPDKWIPLTWESNHPNTVAASLLKQITVSLGLRFLESLCLLNSCNKKPRGHSAVTLPFVQAQCIDFFWLLYTIGPMPRSVMLPLYKSFRVLNIYACMYVYVQTYIYIYKIRLVIE